MGRDTCENLLGLGPDVLAVVMAVEEKFDIIIPAEEAEKILNMGQLYDYVFARVPRGQAQVCFTSTAFYRLRRALGEMCGVPREQVRPQARLEDLIPLNDRAQYWQELQSRFAETHLPRLRRPAWLVKRIEAASFIPLLLLGPSTIVVTIVLFGVLGDTPAVRATAALAGLVCIFVGILGVLLVRWELCRRTERYAVHLPPACATVRDMVYALVSGHSAVPMVSDTTRASDKEIWRTLCAIVGGESDRPPDTFTREHVYLTPGTRPPSTLVRYLPTQSALALPPSPSASAKQER